MINPLAAGLKVIIHVQASTGTEKLKTDAHGLRE